SKFVSATRKKLRTALEAYQAAKLRPIPAVVEHAIDLADQTCAISRAPLRHGRAAAESADAFPQCLRGVRGRSRVSASRRSLPRCRLRRIWMWGSRWSTRFEPASGRCAWAAYVGS